MQRVRFRRTLVAGVALGLAAGLLTACGGSGSGSASKDLVYWSMWNKTEPQAKVLQKAITAFEKSTGINVTVKWVGRTVLTNVSAALTSGSLPDLVDQDGDELTATFSPADSALGLKDVCDATITGEQVKVCGAIPESYVNRYKTGGGEPLMIPYELITSSLWYNGSQFGDVSDNPPKTWDAFLDLLAKQKAAGQVPLALDADQQGYDAYWWEWASVRNAGPGAFLDAVKDKTGAAWDNPKFLTAAKQIEQLVQDKYFGANYGGSKWPAQQTAWANGAGKSDFLLMGSWAPSETAPFAKKNSQKFTYRSFPYPQVEGGNGNEASELYLIGFSIPKKAENPDNAKKFIEFFLNKKYLAGIADVALNITPRADIAVPAQLKDAQEQLENAKSYFNLDDGVSGQFPQFTTEVYYPDVQKLLLGSMSASDFIQAMKKGTVDYWKSHG